MLNFGIDVSRDKLDCAVLDDHGQRVARPRTFANDYQGVLDLIAWARAVAVELPRRFVMEATAAYHELAATRLHGAGLVVSVVNPGRFNCWGNAVMERFFLNLKMERVWRKDYANRAEATTDVADYIVNFYNAVCLHSTLGNLSPIALEHQSTTKKLIELSEKT